MSFGKVADRIGDRVATAPSDAMFRTDLLPISIFFSRVGHVCKPIIKEMSII